MLEYEPMRVCVQKSARVFGYAVRVCQKSVCVRYKSACVLEECVYVTRACVVCVCIKCVCPESVCTDVGEFVERAQCWKYLWPYARVEKDRACVCVFGYLCLCVCVCVQKKFRICGDIKLQDVNVL